MAQFRMADVVSMERTQKEKERRRAQNEEKRAKEKRAKEELEQHTSMPQTARATEIESENSHNTRLEGNLRQAGGPSMPQTVHAIEIESENSHATGLDGNLGQGQADGPGDPYAGLYPDFDLTELGGFFWEWEELAEHNFRSEDAVAGEKSAGQPRPPDHSPDRPPENDQGRPRGPAGAKIAEQSTGTEIAAQRSTVSCDDTVYTETPASASKKPSSGNGPKSRDSALPDEARPSSATLGSSHIQLPPSPDPTEQSSQAGDPPKILPPAGLAEVISPAPDARAKGQHKPARLEIVLSSSSCREQAAEASASRRKRRHQESNAGGDAHKDNEGGGAAKRLKLQAIHSDTRPSPDNPAMRRSGAGRHNSRTASPRTRKRPSPQSRHVSVPPSGNYNLHKRGLPQNHQTKSVQPVNPHALSTRKDPGRGIASRTQQTSRDAVSDGPRASADCSRAALSERSIGLSPTSREMPEDGCSTCGFCAADLVRLADKAWRWIPNDDSVEALFRSTAGLPDVKSLVMLRLCLGSIRDFAREMATTDRESGHLIRPSTLIKSDKTEGMANDTSDGSDHFSDYGGDRSSDDQESDSSESTESSGDTIVVAVENEKSTTQSGQRRKWSALDERRLEAFKKEAKSEKWIAKKLGRTEAAVSQHWNIMCRKQAEIA